MSKRFVDRVLALDPDQIPNLGVPSPFPSGGLAVELLTLPQTNNKETTNVSHHVKGSQIMGIN
jgi:hypothetical protein